MADLKLSSKRLQIDKANASIVVIVAVSSFIIVSSLIFCRSLLTRRSYQSKVIKTQNVAKDQLKENLDSVNSVKAQYQAFADQTQNIIGGNSTGSGDHDGDNARIVLDALPSKYDFPALATSLEKVISKSGVKITTITGTDDEVLQSQNNTDQSVEIPVLVTVSGSYEATKNFVNLMERSIRPMKIKTIAFSGKDSDLTTTVNLITYYRPAKTLNIKLEDVKP